jgi:hypothetical protein
MFLESGPNTHFIYTITLKINIKFPYWVSNLPVRRTTSCTNCQFNSDQSVCCIQTSALSSWIPSCAVTELLVMYRVIKCNCSSVFDDFIKDRKRSSWAIINNHNLHQISQLLTIPPVRNNYRRLLLIHGTISYNLVLVSQAVNISLNASYTQQLSKPSISRSSVINKVPSKKKMGYISCNKIQLNSRIIISISCTQFSNY